jgi:hypothetical protein
MAGCTTLNFVQETSYICISLLLSQKALASSILRLASAFFCKQFHRGEAFSRIESAVAVRASGVHWNVCA